MSALSEIKKEETETKFKLYNLIFSKATIKYPSHHLHMHKNNAYVDDVKDMTHWSSPNDYVIGRTPQIQI